MQSPRIPIWIGGSSRKKGVVRRAARWDGFAPVPIELGGGNWRYLTPDEARELRATIERERGSGAPFDIAVGGNVRGEDWERERALKRSLADAGVTWWLEWVHPGLGGIEAMRAAIRRGPLRAE